MKENIQNTIKYAIASGVNLGFDLCDIDLAVDTKLDTDLLQRKSTFQITDLEDYIKYHINDIDIDEKFLNKSDNIINGCFKYLCTEYNDDLYGVYQAKDNVSLHKIITKCCELYGDNINLNWVNVSGLTDLSELFVWTSFNGDISQWDVSNVTNMDRMFYSSKFNGDISLWDVSQVNNMSCVFRNSQFNGDISLWDVSHVKDMQYIFDASEFNGDISKWDVSHVENMQSMFESSKFQGDISQWDVRNVEDMRWMFMYSKFNGDLSHWNIKNVKRFEKMFYECAFEGNISSWKLSSRTRDIMFYGY